jgi:ATP-dependent Lon protease
MEKYKVPIEKLHWEFTPSEIKEIVSTTKISDEILGQHRAINAIKMFLDINSSGYNLYVAGYPGTGRTTIVKRFLKKAKKRCAMPQDRCYVNNFKEPDNPTLLTFPSGKGKEFKKDMNEFISFVRKNISLIFEEKRFKEQEKSIRDSYMNKKRELVSSFNEKLEREGFSLTEQKIGELTVYDIVPIVDKSIKSSEEIEQERAKLKEELAEIIKKIREIEKELNNELKELERKNVQLLIKPHIDELKEKYNFEKVIKYLEDVESSILENISIFKEETQPEPSTSQIQVDPFLDYEVNVILDTSDQKEPPIIVETSPTMTNLFGTIEKVYDSAGVAYSDFTKIKAGSILKADGGYLLLEAKDVLSNPNVWINLKRVLKTGLLEIQMPEYPQQGSTIVIKPEPIDIIVKVILIGDPLTYQILCEIDEDFYEIFKLKADFDVEMDLKPENIKYFVSILVKQIEKEKIIPLSDDALYKVIEYAVKMTNTKRKITSNFTKVLDVIREASYFARIDNSELIQPIHVEKSIESRRERNNLIESKIQEMIERDIILIDVSGKKEGQINGLTVYSIGDYEFGKPVKITATTGLGKSGVINIEREVNLSGNIHDKGVLILSGYIREKYAQDKPLSLSSSICFEQSYSEIEGDSASAAEIFAILSSLANVPIEQGIAVTGSINQKGDIQAVGGINTKIEGFFEVCKAKGFTGKQGVIIPKKNVDDLMLKQEIIDKIKENKFHIYAIENVDEGIEILTGMKAGEKLPNGKYPENTFNYLVDQRLTEFANRLREYEKL